MSGQFEYVSTADLMDEIHGLMIKAREEQIREGDQVEEDERVFYLQSRDELYPLCLIKSRK